MRDYWYAYGGPEGLRHVIYEGEKGHAESRAIAMCESVVDARRVVAALRFAEVGPGLLAACVEAIPELEATAAAYGDEGGGLGKLVFRMRALVHKAKGGA